MKQRGFGLPSPTMIMAGVIIALSISNMLFFKLWTNKVEEHANYVSEVEAANARIAAENEQRRLVQERIVADVSNAWDTSLRSLTSDYVSRLRGKDRSCAAMSGASATASLAHEATSHIGLGSSQFEAECIKLESNCAETTGQLIWLQHYVKGVCK